MNLTEMLPNHSSEYVAESNLRVHWRGAITLLILNILDIITTYWALSIGAVEGNPIALFLITWQLLIPLKLLGCFTAIWLSRKMTSIEGMSVAGIWFAVGVYSLVIVLNTLMIISYI
jgi:hypothetical protein